MVCKNGCLLIKVNSETEELDNGMVVEARVSSRRKVISGKVIESETEGYDEGDTIWFPLYAGDEVSIRGETFYIIDNKDVKILERVS